MSVINQIQVGSTTYDIQDVAAVPSSRTVNGKALTSNISLTAADVGALASTYTAPVSSVNGQTGAVVLSIPSQASDVGAVPTSRTVNGLALSSNITLNGGNIYSTLGFNPPISGSTYPTLDEVSTNIYQYIGALTSSLAACAPASRTINGYALSSDISLVASDVGALPSTHTVVRLYGVTCNANSAVGDFATVNNAAISSNHIVANIVFSSPNYIRSDVIWTTTDGSLTLNGRCYVATTADIILVYNDVLVS